jgi:hypothetical protein
MRRLPLVLLAIALPAFAQSEEIDAGAPPPTDAGEPEPAVESREGVGRHFGFLWDAEGPARGQTDVQLWATPRWGRPENFLALDVRAGALQGLPAGFSLGFFVDATLSSTGATQEPGIDGRLAVHLGKSFALGPARLGGRCEVSGGPNGISVLGVLAADAQLGAFRVGFNADAWTDVPLTGGGKTRARQTLGLSYLLTNGVSAGLELQNRLSWRRSTYGGDAFLLGPSVGYRGERFWFSLVLLPQVAAVKAADQRGVGDPLELIDNERFSLRLALGLVLQ